MSDFLTNLVMRSYSGTPSVQPMTYSTYAAPEAAPEPVAESFEPVVEEIIPAANEPRRQVFAQKPVQHTDQNESLSMTVEVPKVAEVAEVLTPAIPIQTPELAEPLVVKEKSVSPSPVVETKPPRRTSPNPPPANAVVVKPLIPPPPVGEDVKVATPAKIVEEQEAIVEKTETKTEIQPAQRIHRTPIQTAQPVTRRLVKKTTNSIASPAQPGPSASAPVSPAFKPETRVHKAEPEIIEQVIERSSVTIESTQQVTNAFTTLVPNTTAQLLPALNIKSRPVKPAPEPAVEAEPPAPPAETVINVAIGRIEVRATTASAPRRERQSNGPKVRTLDDYLQQRSRGTQ